jgi:hypothetical protein
MGDIMTTEAIWQRRLERAHRRRENRLREQRERAELRPLRNAVNLALRHAGIPHSVTHYSSRVKGWPISTSEGWETESVYFGNPKYVQVNITAYVGSASYKYDREREMQLRAMVVQALNNFDYRQDGRGYRVYSVKEQS